MRDKGGEGAILILVVVLALAMVGGGAFFMQNRQAAALGRARAEEVRAKTVLEEALREDLQQRLDPRLGDVTKGFRIELPGKVVGQVHECAARLRALDPARFARLTPQRLEHAWELDLSGLRVTADDLALLAALPDLVALDLGQTEIGDAELAELGDLTQLESLGLRGALISDGGLASLAGLQSLDSLDLNATAISDAGLAHVAQLAALETLNLDGTSVTDEGLRALAELGLTRLSLGGLAITDAGLGALANFELLQLSLYRDTGLSDEGLAHLSGQTQLRELNLRGVPLTAEGVGHLVGLDRLETINASLVMDDAGMQHLGQLTGLKTVMLYSSPDLTDVGGVQLANLQACERLSLQFTGVGDGTLAALEGLPLLRFLDLRGTQVSAAALATYRARHPGVRVLD